MCSSANFNAPFPLVSGMPQECFCDQYKTYGGEEIKADYDGFISEYRVRQMEQ